MNLNELLTLTGLNNWLKTISESYKNKEISEIAKRIYKETINNKISENPDYKPLYNEFNLYIKTVKNDGKYVLGLYENNKGSLKFKGVVDKNGVYKPGFINSVKNRPNTKITPKIKVNVPYNVNFGVYIDPVTYLTASVTNNIRGSFSYDITSLGDGYNLAYGFHPVYVKFVPQDLDTYTIANSMYYVNVKYPGFIWKNINNEYVYGELSGSISDYITASFVDEDKEEIDGINELNLESISDLTSSTQYYPVGTYYIYDYFTPDDTNEYEIMTGSKKITVNKFTPRCVWEGLSSSYAYRDLAKDNINQCDVLYFDYNGNSINANRMFNFDSIYVPSEDENYPDVGTYKIYNYFSPIDSDKFNNGTSSFEIEIEPIPPVLGTWSTNMTPYKQDETTFSGSFIIPEGFYTNNYLSNVYRDIEKTTILTASIEYTPAEGEIIEVDENNQFYISASIVPASKNYVPLMDSCQVKILFDGEESTEAK